jgi:Trp operon repressor
VPNRDDLNERLVRIPLMLVGGRRSQRELAREFGVDGVTIRRNLSIGHCNTIDEEEAN